MFTQGQIAKSLVWSGTRDYHKRRDVQVLSLEMVAVLCHIIYILHAVFQISLSLRSTKGLRELSVCSSCVRPLGGDVASASTLEYFITEFSVSVCTFLFEDTYFDSCKQLHFRVIGYCVCVCQAASPDTTSCYMWLRVCRCVMVHVCVSVSEFPSQWPTKLKIQITVLFNHWMSWYTPLDYVQHGNMQRQE